MVLERSFILLDRVGEVTEKRIWDQGVTEWTEFLSRERVRPFSPERKAAANRVLERAKEALSVRAAHFFAGRLRGPHMWRLYQSFRDDAIFLDIETTGLSRSSAVTVVGLYKGDQFKALVRHQDLTRRSLEKAIKGAKVIITFNGSTFDLPMLRNSYPVGALSLPHIDLRYVAARTGYRGGLKRIERQLDVVRDREFAMMTGEDAVRLWRLWERKGNRKALDLLLRYNEADVVNLQTIADILCEEIERRTFS
jgi:uncharacterized protein YprB with RNaseH-like and TPR domain